MRAVDGEKFVDRKRPSRGYPTVEDVVAQSRNRFNHRIPKDLFLAIITASSCYPTMSENNSNLFTMR